MSKKWNDHHCLTDQRSWFRREMKKIAKERGCTEEEARAILAKQIAENRRRRDEPRKL